MRKLASIGAAVIAGATFTAFATAGQPAHTHATKETAISQKLASQIALSRLATAKYASNLALGKKDGYGIITQMIPDMGWHFLNPKDIAGFDVRKPAILVYGKRGSAWQLVAYDYGSSRAKPAKLPLPGAKYGSFGAACHYKDGTFYFRRARTAAAPKPADGRGVQNFWHPDVWSRSTSGRGTRIPTACFRG